MDVAKDCFLNQDMSCAESVFTGGCAQHGIAVTPELIKAMGSFSGGCASGNLCGAAAAGVAIIGIKLGTGKIHQCPQHKEAVKQFMAAFQETFGDTACSVLTPKYKKPDVRCLEIVEKTLEILDNVLQESK